MCEAAGLRTEAGGVLRLAACGDRKQRPAVEGIERRDHAHFRSAEVIVCVAPRKLEGRFVGFRTRVAEEHALGKGCVDQFLRQPQRRFIGHPVGDVPDRARLLVERAYQRRMAMAECGDRDSAGEVDVHAAVLVPHARTFAAHRDELRWREARHHVLVEHGARHRHGRGRRSRRNGRTGVGALGH